MRGAARILGQVAGGIPLLAIAGVGATQWLGGAHAPSALLNSAATVGGSFALTDEDGGTVTGTTWRGRFVLFHPGYRHRPDVCPTEIVEVYDVLPQAARTRTMVAFATMGPERDDAVALHGDTDLLHPALIDLTGTRAQTDASARALPVYHRRVTQGRDADAYLLDPDGRTRQVVPATITAEAMAADLARHNGPALAERRLP